MAKVNLCINYCLRNEKLEYNIKGILQNNKLKYKDILSLIIIDLNNKTLNKINKNEEYLFDFDNNNCLIKYQNMAVNLPIKVLNKEIGSKYIFIKYKIENDIYEIKINIMEEI